MFCRWWFWVPLLYCQTSLLYGIQVLLPLVSGDILFVDLFNRLNLNDSLVNLFNFFWTSITYLAPFFILLVLGTLTLVSVTVPSSLSWGSFIIISYFFEILDSSALNQTPLICDISQVGINLLLINNLNKYHPLIFYTGVSLLLIILIRLGSSPTIGGVFQTQSMLQQIEAFLWVLFKLIAFTLVLGSWWAFQEGTWGGWWNWDPSEVFGLFLFLISIFSIHTISTPALLNFGVERQVLNLISFLSLYFFIQLNFDLTSHSFGTRFTSFFNNSFFFFENLFILVLLGFWLLKQYWLVRSKVTMTLNYLIYPAQTPGALNFYLRLTPTLTLVLVLVISFLPIVNYFVWRYFWLMSFNTFITIETLLSLSYFIILVLMMPVTRYYGLWLLALKGGLGLPLLTISYLTTPFLFTYFNSIHFFLATLVYLNLFLNDFSYTIWSDWRITSDFADTPFIVSCPSKLYTCDSTFIEMNYLRWSMFESCVISTNFYCNANSLAGLNLTLRSNQDSFSTLFYLSSGNLFATLLIDFPKFSAFADLLLVVALFLGLRSLRLPGAKLL